MINLLKKNESYIVISRLLVHIYKLFLQYVRYVKFMLLNQEFTFTVDVSNLQCGLNGALYLVEMDADGGMSYPTNECGAEFGTGYCDAQCPHDMKWINGEANSEDWHPSSNDENSGVGHYGSCCAEMDLWEANNHAQAYTTHPCKVDGQYRCEGTECGDNASDERFVFIKYCYRVNYLFIMYKSWYSA